MTTNILIPALIRTDSYKMSHWLQYPPGTEYVSSYIESRGGKWNETVFFGLQIFLKQYMTRSITLEQIDEAEEFWTAHGEPFNRDGWMYILNEHGGKLPVRIEAVPEGTVIGTGNVLVQIINTDPNVPWLTSYLETMLLRAVWYPTTVATNSFQVKRVIHRFLDETADDTNAEIMFKLHDFGARGVSSSESAMIGGAAHLVNFKGTDTAEGLWGVRKFYSESMAGFSIPAAEHSTITSWGGPSKEIEAFQNMIEKFGKPGALVAVVSDSYDIYHATETLWGLKLLQAVKDSGATIVVRPDSGDPRKVPIEVISLLMAKAGHTVNSKGFKVLPPYFRVIQGDGVNIESITDILTGLRQCGLSASNIAFGMGGALLQQLDRDTLKFAMKASAIQVNGHWRDVFKDPVTDHGKVSKKGRLALIKTNGGFKTVPKITTPLVDNVLQVVYENGCLRNTTTFTEVRARAAEGLKALLAS